MKRAQWLLELVAVGRSAALGLGALLVAVLGGRVRVVRASLLHYLGASSTRDYHTNISDKIANAFNNNNNHLSSILTCLGLGPRDGLVASVGLVGSRGSASSACTCAAAPTGASGARVAVLEEDKGGYERRAFAVDAEHELAVVVDGELDVDVGLGRAELQRGQIVLVDGDLVAHDGAILVGYVVVAHLAHVERRAYVGLGAARHHERRQRADETQAPAARRRYRRGSSSGGGGGSSCSSGICSRTCRCCRGGGRGHCVCDTRLG